MSDVVASQPPDPKRASDADRDRVLQLLATATADGRLTVDEHSDLMSRALSARTMGELDVITKDLSPDEVPQPVQPPTAQRGSPRRGLFALFGARTKKGVWHVPREFRATAVFGAVELDFRDAQFDANEVVIAAHSIFGAVEITVPEWVRVEDEGHVIFGAWDVHGAHGSDGGSASAPRVTIRLQGLTIFGAVEVKYKAQKLKKAGAPKLTGPDGSGS